jgi:thioredoxin 1
MTQQDKENQTVAHIMSGEQWTAEVLDSKLPVLVDFWAEWCGPCRMVGPAIEQLAGEYEGRVKFVKVNVDDNGELAERYGIVSIPTLSVFKDGKTAAQKIGAVAKGSIKEMIDEAALAA